MPVKRSSKLRLATIDSCLRNVKFKWNWESLLFQVNCKLEENWYNPVTKEQLIEDIEVMMNDFHAPITVLKEGRKIYYEYGDPTFSIHNTPVSPEGLTRIQEASQILKGIRSFNFADDLAFTINRLDNRYKLANSEHTIVHFEEAASGQEAEYIDSIKEAILAKHVLKIAYRKLGSAQQDQFIVHPYFLKEYQGRWYLFGYSETSKSPRLYALDRIQGVGPTDNTYTENRFISSDVYFNQLIGVMVNGSSKPEDIALWISPQAAPLVLSRPIHHSQFRENLDHSGLFIALHVVVNPELISILLSYGADLKVLYPEHLAEKIKETAWKMAEQYNRE